jgi:dihydrofolate synthase / folylpolyglutamate synthase
MATNLARALTWLDEHINLEATAGKVEGLSLAHMRELVRALGEPQQDFPTIHITGTNGKGSTAAMVSAILSDIGLSVGTYGSPHVSQLGERIQYNRLPIPDDDLADVLDDLRRLEPHLADRPSWFELMTAAALRYFADQAVDVAVVEVGKLGRYDATNVVEGEVAVITNIGFDHTDGGSGWREAIASEKAGIIRPDATLVLGETEPSLRSIFDAEGAARTIVRDQDFGCIENRLSIGGRLVSLRTLDHDVDDIFVSLLGAHQGENAAIALAAVEAFLGTPVQREVIESALGSVSLPGRFELVGREPLVVIDGAHNPDGAEVAIATWRESIRVPGRQHLLVGMLSERDPRQMLEALEARSFDTVTCCRPPSPRALPAETLAGVARAMGIDAEAIDDPAEAYEAVIDEAQADDGVLVAGSLYLAGSARDAAGVRYPPAP